DTVVKLRQRRVRAQKGVHFALVPEVELTLHALGVSVQGAVKAAFRAEHFALRPVNSFFYDAPVEWLARKLPGLGVAPQQLGVVVEHLLEVGYEPARIGAVAGEAAAEL